MKKLLLIIFFSVICGIIYTICGFIKENCFLSTFCEYASLAESPEIKKLDDLLSNYEDNHFGIKDNKNVYVSCPVGTHILIGISSISKRQRQSIRLGWSKLLKQLKNIKISYLFFTGINDRRRIGEIMEEISIHKDIVFLNNFTESYSRLYFKTIQMMNWYYDNCPSSIGFLKIDDDIFLNVFLLVSLLQSYMPVILSQPLIIGKVFHNSQPSRDPDSKHFVSYRDYNKEFYPKYVTGGCYFLNRWAVAKLVQEDSSSDRASFFHRWEDVGVTGTLVARINRESTIIVHHNTHQMFTEYSDNACILASSIAAHNVLYGYQLFLASIFNRGGLMTRFCYNPLQRFVFLV